MKEPLWLSPEAVRAFHVRLLADFGGSEGVRDEGLLESALSKPANLYHYEKADLFALAAAYAFGIVKNHPFIDGNKRTGFVAAAVFLDLNGHELIAPETEATLKTLALASGAITQAELAGWLKQSTQLRRGRRR